MSVIDILMMDSKDSETMWNNERLSEYVTEYMTPSDINNGYFDGPYVRMMIDTKGKRFNLVVLLEPGVIEKIWPMDDADPKKCNQEYVQPIIDEVGVLLLEDVWIDRGEQFCFTPQGEWIASMLKKKHSIFISPDVGLRPDSSSKPDGPWGFCT